MGSNAQRLGMRQHVWELANFGFHEAAAAVPAIVARPWAHVYCWLKYEYPTPAQLRRLLFHLEALSKDRFVPRPRGTTFTPTDFDALARQLAEFLADRLMAQLSRNPAVEALIHGNFDQGLQPIEQPREVARLLGLLRVVEPHFAWPEAQVPGDLADTLERRLRKVNEPAFELDFQSAARITARVLAILASLRSGARAAISIPLAGEHPSVVRLMISCTLAADESPAPSPKKKGGKSGPAPLEETAVSAVSAPVPPKAEWAGLAVAPDVQNGMADLLAALDRMFPAIPTPSRVFAFISESRHRPLNRAVRIMAGRSWELGGVFAMLMAISGASVDRIAATGQVNWANGRVESVTGIEDKVEALYACRHPEIGPIIDTFFCPVPNVGAAERAARRIGWNELTVTGIATVDELLNYCGPDPWQAYCRQLVERAAGERATLGAEAKLVDDWAERLQTGERVLVIPSPFGVDAAIWCRQIAAALATLRLDRLAHRPPGSKTPAWGGVPVVLPDESDVSTFGALIAHAVRAVSADVPEQTWANTFQSPDGFIFLHADPAGQSPLLMPDPPAANLALSRKHPAYRHRFCFVANDLHQLKLWQSNPVFAKL